MNSTTKTTIAFAATAVPGAFVMVAARTAGQITSTLAAGQTANARITPLLGRCLR